MKRQREREKQIKKDKHARDTRDGTARTSEGTKVLNRPWQRNCSFISIKQEVRKFNYRC